MSHLIPQAVHGLFVVCETTRGVEVFPADLVGFDAPFDEVEPTESIKMKLDEYTDGIIKSVECVTGWFARLSAPGYIDCTEWCGPFSSEQEASSYLKRIYEDY